MMRTWNTLALASLLAASPSLVRAGGQPDEADVKKLNKSVDELRKTVEALSKKVDSATAAMSSKEVLAEIAKLEKSIRGHADKTSASLQKQINEITAEQLREKLPQFDFVVHDEGFTGHDATSRGKSCRRPKGSSAWPPAASNWWTPSR